MAQIDLTNCTIFIKDAWILSIRDGQDASLFGPGIPTKYNVVTSSIIVTDIPEHIEFDVDDEIKISGIWYSWLGIQLKFNSIITEVHDYDEIFDDIWEVKCDFTFTSTGKKTSYFC